MHALQTTAKNRHDGRDNGVDPAMTEHPLVSVIIPVFNAAPYLRESIDSVLGQDYPSIELILVDDGSTDGSHEILSSYGERIRVLRQDRKGPAAARNRGVGIARGAYIAFHDADDVWLPGKLSTQMDFVREHPEFRIVFGQFAFWRPDANARYPDPTQLLEQPELWEIKQELSGKIFVDQLIESSIAMITPVVHREVFDAIGGFDESLLGGSDYDFWLKATYRFNAHKLPYCFAAYRLHASSVTRTPKPTNFAFTVLKRAVDAHGVTGPDGRHADPIRVAQRLADTWLDYALVHIARGSKSLGIRGLVHYVRESPRPIRALARSALVLAKSVLPRARTR